MMRRFALRCFIALGMLIASVSAQTRKAQETRRPAVNAPASTTSTPAPSGEYFSILDGTPVLLELHHDTEVGTNRPIDVYKFVIELQVMNSDGDLEPVGLQIFNYYTAIPLDPSNDIYAHAARDCNTWNKIVLRDIQQRKANSKTWPYIEFTVAQGARVLQTNEDGAVWWSDDVECWESSDRFPPF